MNRTKKETQTASLLSCLCQAVAGGGRGGDGTTVAFWPLFSIHVNTPSRLQACVWTSKFGWSVVCEDTTYLSWSYNRLLGELRRINSLSCIAYLFIYLMFLYSPQGGFTHSGHALFSNFLLDAHCYINSHAFKEPPSRTVVLIVHWASPPEKLEVECLSQGHLDTSCWGSFECVTHSLVREITSLLLWILNCRYPKYWHVLNYSVCF